MDKHLYPNPLSGIKTRMDSVGDTVSETLAAYRAPTRHHGMGIGSSPIPMVRRSSAAAKSGFISRNSEA